MKKSPNGDSLRPKLALRRETIVLLRLLELGEVQGGRTVTVNTVYVEASNNDAC